MEFSNKYYNMLELDKIIVKVQEYVKLDASMRRLNSIEPMIDLFSIEKELKSVEEATILIKRYSRFSIYFKRDVNYYFSKISKNADVNIEELIEISNFIDTIRDLFVYVQKLEANKIVCTYFGESISNINYPKELNLRIKQIISPIGEILDTASANLKQIRRQISINEQNLQTKLKEILNKNQQYLSQNVISMRDDRYVLPVKSEYKNKISGLIHDQSSSGETSFIEPIAICNLNNKLISLKEDEVREIKKILHELSQNILVCSDDLIYANNIIIDLDIRFAKAMYANTLNASRPNVNNNGELALYECYHPLLEVKKIVKNNVLLGKEYKGIIITGPNTGGKTVLLKTVGLLSLMVKFGLLIPASKSSTVNIYSNVFVDIGDEQSISQNLSTFSSHLKNVIKITEHADSTSLVLLDELGSGTDPTEGSAIAIAILDYLLDRKCNIICTSHYSELKLHAYKRSDIINASVKFDEVSLKPAFKLLLGVAGMSNAINIASNLGLNKEIVHSATSHAEKKNDKTNIILEKLVRESQELNEQLEVIKKEKHDLNEMKQDLNNKIADIVSSKNKIIEEANKSKQKIIEKSQKEMDEILFELRNISKNNLKTNELADIKHSIKKLRDNDLKTQNIQQDTELKKGMRVYISVYDTYGIINKKLSSHRYEVQMGIAQMDLDDEYLRIAKGEKEISLKKPTSTIVMRKAVTGTLDLRGKRYEEANDMIDKYLDDALYAGLVSISIIHGFGSGVIRKLVQEKLKSNKNIKEYRYGDAHEGGHGCTIAIFSNN